MRSFEATKRPSLWTRYLRWLTDGRQLVHLQDMDERMLRDIGLTRADVARRVPFKSPRVFH